MERDPHSGASSDPRRPRLLPIFLLIMSAANVMSVVLSVQQAIQLPDLQTSLSPIYLAASSAVWALVFFVCAVGARLSTRWAPAASLLVMAGYQANLWLTRLAFSRNEEATEVTGFRILLTLACFAILLILLALPLISSIWQRLRSDER
jgi:hypothetical protein